jgi:hypothetical protein
MIDIAPCQAIDAAPALQPAEGTMSKLARRLVAADAIPIIMRAAALATVTFAAVHGLGAPRDARAQQIPNVAARVVAVGIPGASALAQVGTFLNAVAQGACAAPIPTKFPQSVLPGQMLDPIRILVGSRSNFGAPSATGVGQDGPFLSIDPTGAEVLDIPPDFAVSGMQASALGGAVQMFSANSPNWLNILNNPTAFTRIYAGVSNPLGLSNNNAFGRIWPANSPFGLTGPGSSSILDPNGRPLAGAPNSAIGGVYEGDLTNRNAVTKPPQPQVIPGALTTGAVGTALLGPSPDGSCKAVFAVVTADGAIVQEHTVKGLDGLAPPGTVRPLLGGNGNSQGEVNEPRFGVIMNPYTGSATVVRQLFVSEPLENTIAVVDLTIAGTAPNQVFDLGLVARISSPALNLPVDLTPVQRDSVNFRWASNTTLDDGSDFYVANQGDNTIVRMRQDGTVVAIRRVTVNGQPLNNVGLNGIAASADATDTTPPTTIYVTIVDPNTGHGGVLAMPAF